MMFVLFFIDQAKEQGIELDGLRSQLKLDVSKGSIYDKSRSFNTVNKINKLLRTTKNTLGGLRPVTEPDIDLIYDTDL